MPKNGGLIGKKNIPNVSEKASGVWNLDEQQQLKSANRWPIIAPFQNLLFFQLDAYETNRFDFSILPNITTWTSTDGLSYFTQSIAASKPTYLVNAYNGKPGVYFDGADSLYGSQTFLPQYFSIFIVSRISNSGMLIELSADANNGGLYLYNTGNSAMVKSGATSSAFTISDQWQNSTIPAVINFNYGAMYGTTVYKNNSLLGSNATTIGKLATNSNFFLMSRGNTTLYATGTIFEILVYNTELSATDRTAVYNYLNTKWL